MRETTLVVSIAVALVMVVAVPAVGMAATVDAGIAQADENATENENATVDENATAPGEQLSGVVGVGEAELEGDIEQRTFGIRVAQAATNQNARADVVAEQLGDIEQRLEDLEQRKAELDEKREAGEMSEGKYRAEVAKLAAETETARQLANQSEQVAGELPADLLEEHNVNVTAIQTLQDRADELSGPEVAEIARGIAGAGVGETPVDDRPVNVSDRGDGGPDDRPGEDRGPDETPDDETTDENTPDQTGEETPDGEEPDQTDEETPDAGNGNSGTQSDGY